ncbi:MAG: SGNH/GDSL hydrolase family protein [Lentisphaerae bacterium]|nr:SGNH/GDSL hydrolase family protein [Lentisphaerota bacterium]
MRRQKITHHGMRREVAFSLLLLLADVGAPAADDAVPLFKDGDRVVFIGDSITHGDAGVHDFHTFILLYYATRFPDRKVLIYDSGIGGDKAPGAVNRFSWDVGDYNPTVCPIMLGMNDARVCYTFEDGLGAPDVNAGVLRDAKENLATYRKHMTALLELVKKTGAAPILITPSPYDDTAVLEENKMPALGKNKALGVFGKCVRELGQEFDAPVVDYWTPMTELALERQKREDPSFTLTRPTDRTHPERPGHFVMAYLFLKAQNAPKVVSVVAVDARGGAVKVAENCKAKDVTSQDGLVKFSLLANALPFPASVEDRRYDVKSDALKQLTGAAVGTKGALGVDLVPFMAEMNQEIVRVENLPGGRYALSIDGRKVGEHDATDLAKGISLAANEKTPQYGQALEVAKLNLERDHLSSSALRSLAFVKSKMLPGKIKDKPFKAQVAYLKKSLGSDPSPYFKGMVAAYEKYKPREKEVREEIHELFDRIYEVNKPKWHEYEIRKVD